MENNVFYATGKRKNAVARIRLMPGGGKFEINSKTLDDYFGRETSKMIIRQPLELTDTKERYDIYVNVRGGGISSQAAAIKHGVSRALLEANSDLRGILKKAGFLTRDSRIKERKKYGQRKARAKFQYSKR
ncbi:MAG: 30S ribosomal protein S9 [Deltaproteobacteria bacterium DG_8]|nr:MAG: 30S ribosomal protein S9 [Deltaproteobacteria bacterium DG_8]